MCYGQVNTYGGCFYGSLLAGPGHRVGLCGPHRDAESFRDQRRSDPAPPAADSHRADRDFFDVSLLLACFFGIGALVERFSLLQAAVLAAGGLVVCWIGVGLIREKPSMDQSVDMDIPLPKIAAKAFVVTWLNPQALIDGTLLYGSFRAGHPGADSTLLVLGSATASCLWFSGVTLLISLFSARFSDRVLRIINVVCGSVILVYGLRLILQFLRSI